MPDFFSYELVEAMVRPGCPVCAALDVADKRWIDSFWREGRFDRGARRRFYAAGGFCREHAWRLHESVEKAAAGSAIADVYGNLAGMDLDRLAEVSDGLASARRRRRLHLTRKAECPACVERKRDLERNAYFLTEALQEESVRGRYVRSDGLCFEHLAAVAEYASTEAPDVAAFLLDDWRRRLTELRDQLAEYDRKRDYRYKHEPRGDEQHSWTDAIARYAGRPPRSAGS